MRYAEVAVDAPVTPERTFSYRVPQALTVAQGQMVLVPFGPRLAQGVVDQLSQEPQVEVVKDIIATLHPSPLVSPNRLKLAHWISRYYLCSLFDALALMLPPGFKERMRPYYEASLRRERSPRPISDRAQTVLAYLKSHDRASEAQLRGLLGKGAEREVASMLRRGLLQRRWELPRPKVAPRYQCFICSAPSPASMPEESSFPAKKAPKQRALLEALAQQGLRLPIALANKEYSSGAMRSLWQKGLLALEWVKAERGTGVKIAELPYENDDIKLTVEQEDALSQIFTALDGHPGSHQSFLLHGVTGSGKTEVYIRALERCVAMGKQGIFLVPEIALTPQTLHRLNARFPGRVAIVHSGLPLGAQFDQWWRIRQGEYDVVVGARSALFAPVPDLGLIVIDEEHEWTYKQEESPRYHAREAALHLAELLGVTVVMGSATPDVESYYWAKAGKHRFLELPQRVPAPNDAPSIRQQLPRVELCNMRIELMEGNRSIFSRALSSALQQCVAQNHQAILYLNRRGAATVVQCRECAFVARCRRCTVTLTYHATVSRLLCHLCNRRSSIPTRCPQCGSPRIRYLGLGTQRVVEELAQLLPHTPVMRWDMDAVRGRGAHQQMLERFSRGEAQVLVGTQMVTKGLHVPNVTLVGVILADLGLNLPDFRAAERAFQLLCQVAGRAGRGAVPGRVVIQTYDPDNYAVKAAASQDYEALYETELKYRQQLGNPPFNQLVRMVYLHPILEACQRGAQGMARLLRHKIATQGLSDVNIVGPAPAFHQRQRGKYRWHIVLRGPKLQSLLEDVPISDGWIVDVDPVSVL